MASRIRAFDWTRTPLGPMDRWPPDLKVLVQLMLAHDNPSCMCVGEVGNLIYNDSYAGIIGSKHPHALGESVRIALPEPDLAATFVRAMQGETISLTDAFAPLSRDGAMLEAWFDIRSIPAKDDTGVVFAVFFSIQETTARVLAEKALKASEEQYRTLFQSIDESFAIIEMIRDNDGRFVDYRILETNPAFFVHTGLSNAVGRTAKELVPQLEPDWIELYGRVVVSRQAVRLTLGVAGLDRLFDVYVLPVGAPTQLRAAVLGTDVTARKHAETVLRDNERRHAFLLRFSDTIRLLTNPDEIAVTATRMVADHFKVDRSFISLIAREDGKAWIKYETRKPHLVSVEGEVNLADFPEVMRIAETKTMIFRDVQADTTLSARDKAALGGLGFGAFIAAVLRKGEKNYFWDLVVATVEPRNWSPADVPLLEEIAERTWVAMERARAEKALLETEKLAVVGRLASSIAHEINNPLEAIVNLLYLMESTRLPADAAQFLQQAQAQLSRVSQITVETLRFSKQNTIATGVKLSELIESVVSLHEPKLKNARVVVERRYKDRETLICFPNELRQVIANLIGNAIEAMIGSDDSRLYLRVRDARDPRTGTAGFRLTVADTGSGMSRATLQRIWEPFFTTKGATGNGLGLWVAQEIIRKHYGIVSVRSSTGDTYRGTIFSIFLPHITM